MENGFHQNINCSYYATCGIFMCFMQTRYVCFWSHWNMHYIGGTVVSTTVDHVPPVRYNNYSEWFSQSRFFYVLCYEVFWSLTRENLFNLPSTLTSLSYMCDWFHLGSYRGLHKRISKGYIFLPLPPYIREYQKDTSSFHCPL